MKIGWILSGNKNIAGARIQGWNMHEYLLQKGIQSEIISFNHYNYDLKFTKNEINEILERNFDVILLQKIQTGENFNYLIKQAHKKSTKIIFIGIDRINVDFAVMCDTIIVVSKYLKKLIPEAHQKKTFKVFDSYDNPDNKCKKHSNKKKLSLVFVSNNVFSKFPQIPFLPKNVSLTIIGPPEERVKKFTPNEKMFTETPYNFKYLVWNLDEVQKEILKCDVGVIPYPDELLKKDYIIRKSSNRLLMFMSYELPTIVSPHPEYKPLIKQGKNGFIANNPSEWIGYIEFLRDNPDKRKEIGQKARLSVIDKYSLKRQGELYLKIIKKSINDVKKSQAP